MSYYPQSPQAYPQNLPPGYPAMSTAPKAPRRYSIFGAMIRSPLFVSDVWRDVARNWGGIGFWYLFLLLLITWIAVMAKIHVALTGFAKNDFPSVVANVPPITIDKGHVSSPVEQPYYMKDSKTGKTFAVLDTTGTINSMDDTDATILITDHKLWVRQNGNTNDIRETDLSKVNYFFLDKTKLTRWMNTLSSFFAIGALPLVLIFAMVFRLIQALIYGGLNMALSAGFNANLTYAAAMRLAVLSVTPVILLDTIFFLTNINIPLWFLLGIGVSVVYMVMAVRANSQPAVPITGYPATPWPPAGGAPPPPPGDYSQQR